MKISILLATYNPNITWLEQQMISIKNQTYRNIEIIILDDASDNFLEIKSLVASFGCKILKNSENIGSNKTFEKLVSLATGDYIAFCDQDDIWHKNKLETLLNKIKNPETCSLVYSDVCVIDSVGTLMHISITKARKRHVLYHGTNITKHFYYSNCVIGCTMLIKTDIAKLAIPFPKNLVHDHYLALIASTKGEICLVNFPLINYRTHDNNQTGILYGINSKQDYYNLKILKQKLAFDEIKDLIYTPTNDVLDRIAYYNGDITKIFKIYKNNPKSIALFEIFVMKAPNFIFNKIIKLIKNGNI